MAAIEVGSVTTSTEREHFGHALRSDLVFALDGSGQSAGDKPYILTATVTDSLQNPIVSSATGRAATGTITAAARWQVENRATGEIVYSGSADASASYDRTIQRFASLRAERDAEIRLARQLAEQIANRLAIKIHTARQSR